MLYILASGGGNPVGHKTSLASWIVFVVILVILVGIFFFRATRRK